MAQLFRLRIARYRQQAAKHLLAIDYALKPVLWALGATHVLSGLFISDERVQRDLYGHLVLDETIEQRLDEQIDALVSATGFVASQP